MPDWFSQNAPKSAPAAAGGGGNWFALHDPARKPASAEDFMTPEEIQLRDGPKGSAGSRLVSNLAHAFNPVTIAKGLYEAAKPDPNHPEDASLGPMAPLAPLVRGAVRAGVDQGRKAVEDVKAGRYAEGAARGTAALIPLMGPAAVGLGEQAATGDVAGAVGGAVGLLAPIGVGKIVPKNIRIPGLSAAPDAADALALAERAGIAVDAGTATGNKFVKAAQHVSDRSLAGSVVAGQAQKAQQAGLATLGEQLAAKARPQAVTASEAGSAAQKGVGKVVSESRAAADTAYGKLRAIEEQAMAQPAPAPGQPLTPSPMVVDLAPVKAALAPIAERLAASKRVKGVLLGPEGEAAARIDALLSSPDAVPLSIADAALSDLKRLARTDNPNLRSVGQGIAAKATRELHQAVSRGAKEGGPEAVAALDEGRAATQAKYAAAKLLKNLEGRAGDKSPVTAFRSMTKADDVGLGQLQAVLTKTPQAKPMIARAVLDRLIDHPTAGPAKTWSDWQKIGPETKAALYSPEHVKDLDAFFKLRKMMADNPNPSGTAHTMLTAGQAGLMFAEPVSGAAVQIGTGLLSTLLHSRRGVRLLTRGMRIPVRNKAAASAWAADLAAATGGATSPSGSRPSPAGAPAR